MINPSALNKYLLVMEDCLLLSLTEELLPLCWTSPIASSSGTMTLRSDSTNDKGSIAVPRRSRAVWTANACSIAPIIALRWPCVNRALFLAI